MPRVKVDGKYKKFPYSKKGKAMAKKAKKKYGGMKKKKK